MSAGKGDLTTEQRLARFAMEMLRAGWEGSGLDGGDIQDAAEKYGLIVSTTYSQAVHGENDVGAEDGDAWFVVSPAVRALAASEAAQPTAEGEQP